MFSNLFYICGIFLLVLMYVTYHIFELLDWIFISSVDFKFYEIGELVINDIDNVIMETGITYVCSSF